MLIKLSTTIALSCPACGRMERDEFDVFDLPLGEIKKLKCSCGAEKAALKRNANSEVEIDYSCLHCNTAHKVNISHNKFWHSKNLEALSCKETGLNPGFFGKTKLVDSELKKEKQDLELLAEELGFDDFKAPDIMLQALDFLDDLAANSDLSCQCGNHNINIELFFDRIQLRCSNCSSYIDVKAVSKLDLKNLRQLNKLKLPTIQGKSNNF